MKPSNSSAEFQERFDENEHPHPMPANREQAPSPFPNIVWQVCELRDRLPAEYQACRASWLEANPEWKIELVTNQESRALFAEHLPHLLELFDRLPLGVMKADMWRYAVLLIHGGVYADVDTYCRAPIESWLSPSSQSLLHICCEEGTPWFCQWTMSAPAGHPVLKTALELIAERVVSDGGVDLERPDCVHYYTGPDLWSEAVKQTLGTVLPPHRILAHPALAVSAAIKVHPTGFFAGVAVSHGYASFNWGGDGYISWRDDIGKKLLELYRPRSERLKELLVPKVTAPLKRYGGFKDGSFVLSPPLLCESAYLLSLGNDEEFDLEVAAAGTEIVTRFRDVIEDGSISLDDLVEMCDAEHLGRSETNGKKRDFSLKIDVEGSEYALLLNCSDESLHRCVQLAIEFHNLPNGGRMDGILIEEDWHTRERVLLKLLKTHHLVHLHGNNHKGFVHGFPEVLECLFVNKRCLGTEPAVSTTGCPQSGLDRPSRPDMPDLSFDWWTTRTDS